MATRGAKCGGNDMTPRNEQGKHGKGHSSRERPSWNYSILRLYILEINSRDHDRVGRPNTVGRHRKTPVPPARPVSFASYFSTPSDAPAIMKSSTDAHGGARPPSCPQLVPAERQMRGQHATGLDTTQAKGQGGGPSPREPR